MGDSWSSGVSYDGANTDWDGNAYGCLRIKTSYEAQMAADNRWTNLANDLHFASCSGAIMAHIAQDPIDFTRHPDPQIADIGFPTALTMEIGGNNLDFGKLIRVCFLRSDPGVCASTFAAVKGRILDRKVFYYDYKATLQDVLRYPSTYRFLYRIFQGDGINIK
jgi:hypothetical protein